MWGLLSMFQLTLGEKFDGRASKLTHQNMQFQEIANTKQCVEKDDTLSFAIRTSFRVLRLAF